MTKVLVTGASGFIGFHLVRALVDRGEEVTAMDRRPPSLWEPDRLGVRFLRRRRGRPGGHCRRRGGAIVRLSPGRMRGRPASGRVPSRQRGRDGGGVRGMRPAGNAAGARDALLDGRQRPGGTAAPAQEDDPPEPVSHYGRSKRAGELAAEQWGDRAPITIVRPAIVFGEADPHCLSIYRSVNWSHIHFVPGRIPKRHSWIHAADLSRLLILAAAQGERLPPRGAMRQPRAAADTTWPTAVSSRPTRRWGG